MDSNVSFSFVQILDSARLRYLLNRNDIDFDKVFEELKVVVSDPPKANPNEPLHCVEKQLAEQKDRFENAIKFKYIITRLTNNRRMTPTLKYFLSTVDNLIAAEAFAYKVLLNYEDLKQCLKEQFKTGFWVDKDWLESTV